MRRQHLYTEIVHWKCCSHILSVNSSLLFTEVKECVEPFYLHASRAGEAGIVFTCVCPCVRVSESLNVYLLKNRNYYWRNLVGICVSVPRQVIRFPWSLTFNLKNCFLAFPVFSCGLRNGSAHVCAVLGHTG